jgi:hypothetical protein
MCADKSIQIMFFNQHHNEFEEVVNASAIEAADDHELNERDAELH